MSAPQKSNATAWLILLGVVALAWSLFRGGAGSSLHSLQGKPLPSLAAPGTWLNSEPRSWDVLAGQVVWLEFSFLH